MAFTITMLSWSAVDFRAQLEAKKELSNALDAIKWGADYLIKAHPKPNVLYGEVGDGNSDHECWQRPEDMTTPRTSYRIDEQHPGSDLAAETAAALAAASIAFKETDSIYASQLLGHAKQVSHHHHHSHHHYRRRSYNHYRNLSFWMYVIFCFLTTLVGCMYVLLNYFAPLWKLNFFLYLCLTLCRMLKI